MLDGYTRTPHGIVRQNDLTPTVTYNMDYVRERYDRYPTTRAMSLLRLRLLRATTGLTEGDRILDVGYGNGDFLAVCRDHGFGGFGFDISGYPLPSGVQFAAGLFDSYHCVTFFDSLEHMPAIDFIHRLDTRYLAISVPWCHYPSDHWFLDWKHRRPGEHLFHFDHLSLCNFMRDEGFRQLFLGNPEDRIRSSPDFLPNILTAVFERK